MALLDLTSIVLCTLLYHTRLVERHTTAVGSIISGAAEVQSSTGIYLNADVQQTLPKSIESEEPVVIFSARAQQQMSILK